LVTFPSAWFAVAIALVVPLIPVLLVSRRGTNARLSTDTNE